MTAGGKSKPGINYPLWIIAISLLVIAICVVVDSIQRQNNARNPESLPAETAYNPQPEYSPNRSAIRAATRPRTRPPPEPSEENAESAKPAADVTAPAVAALPPSHPNIGGPQPVGYSVSGILVGSNQMGEVTGRVTLRGSPPAETILSADPICSQRSGPIMTRTFVVGESNGLADAVVFLKMGIDAASLPKPTNAAMVAFTNCEIQPHIIAVTALQLMRFQDREGAEHVLNFGDLRPQLVVPAKADAQFRLTRPRLFVPVRCRAHPWENASICILENPYFAVTDEDGNFDIPNVPPGTYTIEVAHQGATNTNGVTRSVIVVAGKKAELNVALNVPNHGAPPATQAGNSPSRN